MTVLDDKTAPRGTFWCSRNSSVRWGIMGGVLLRLQERCFGSTLRGRGWISEINPWLLLRFLVWVMAYLRIYPTTCQPLPLFHWDSFNIYLVGVDLKNRSLLGGIVALIPGGVWGTQTVPGARFLRNRPVLGGIVTFGEFCQRWGMLVFRLRETDSCQFLGLFANSKGGTLPNHLYACFSCR